ncbi:cation diffusion facilitator family transporter [Paenibacillus gansuensis]|uniref:Cation diffusion facilitator family transporter n=1 Tax=Paenibacillus gansuensis TaxID=306542 RepID=A0ABW5PHV4_9BACL
MEEQKLKDSYKSSIYAAWISLISNILLTGIKIVTGFLFNSPVLLADGIHNAGDVIASAASLSSMRISKLPPDEDHPYGHGKAEVVGAAIVAGILALAAVYIGYEAVAALFEPFGEPHWIAFIAAVVSLVWKQTLYIYTMRIGREANSKGLIATAKDHLADVYASGAAVVGIGLGLIAQVYDIRILQYGDPVAGIIVALLVLKLSYEMAKEALDVLMEKSVPLETIQAYTQRIEAIPEIKRIDRIRAREHGHYVIVDVRVGIDATLTIQEGHDISRKLKTALKEQFSDIEEVLVHINPWYENEKED